MPVLVSTCGICTLAPGTPSREPPGVSSNASTGETRTSTMLERMRTSRVCPAGSNVTSACVRRMMPACGESAIEVWALAWPLKMDAHAGSRSAASVSARQARPSWPGPRAAGLVASRRMRAPGERQEVSPIYRHAYQSFRIRVLGMTRRARREPPRIDARACAQANGKGRSVVQLDVELHRGLGARLEFTHVAGDRAGAAIGRRGGLTRGADGRVLDVDVGRRPGPNRS